ncbi:cell wall lytic activity [Calidifontibacter sp. DB0510]|uniref:Cell wall lytic activity n=1 Tax=Metallococcus carri TaxID=1656884 RepID=A0A967EG69_9MICO|nr:NlpC/P60 family protein [Metallococcus carri]NHN57286.1 cell wall lytic activity [Metallococcus carri]NOP38109.1 cell wall lytic activity [Calidifontibacter sp. DB2511S]
MGSYQPRHLKHEPSVFGSKAARRGLIAAATAAVVIPTASEAASAAPVPTAAAVKTSPSHVVVVRYGQTGYYVRVVQQRVGGLAVDGSFGPRTLAAVKRFQRAHGLVQDGIVGPLTWRALGGQPGYRSGSTAPVSRSGSGSSAIVSIAKQYQGVPYVWGGSTPAGFDCSGFTSYVYKRAGIYIPRTASAQQRYVRRVSSPVPGDLVFSGFPAYHVAIYVGGGMQIAASKPGTSIAIKQIWGYKTYGRA